MEKHADYAQLLRLAQSPEGQQLLKLLQQSGGDSLKTAAAAASAGDFQQAKNLLSSLLSTPEAEKLIKQLEERL